MDPRTILSLDPPARRRLWEQVVAEIESYHAGLPQAAVAPPVDLARVRALLDSVDPGRPLAPAAAVDFVVRGLRENLVHVAHPRYFGLFNPTPAAMSVAADTLAAAFNPQLATASHSPFPVEVERWLIRAFAGRFGYAPEAADGTFAGGGAEANHTAVLTALAHAFPLFRRRGLRALDRQPVLYVSAQSHHSFIKAARACGLGDEAVRRVPADGDLRLDPSALAEQVARDRAAGLAPFLAAATAGTTSAGIVDPLAELAAVAQRERLWLHTDAAWGGAAVFAPELRPLLAGIERSDSITFDAHKWLSVPMGAGIYLTRHPGILGETFGISTEYMPRLDPERKAAGAGPARAEPPDPYTHSIQWSRRFIGLKVFLALATAGWEGYAAVIRHQAAMGDLLREELAAAGWRVVNRTRLPVVCFVDGSGARAGGSAPAGEGAPAAGGGQEEAAFLEAVARAVVACGEAWLSTTRLAADLPVLRACITSFRTGPEDVRALVGALERARRQLRGMERL